MYISNVYKLMIFFLMPESPSHHLLFDEVMSVRKDLFALLVSLLCCSKQMHHLVDAINFFISISSESTRSNSCCSNKLLSLNTFRPTQPPCRTTSTLMVTVSYERLQQ